MGRDAYESQASLPSRAAAWPPSPTPGGVPTSGTGPTALREESHGHRFSPHGGRGGGRHPRLRCDVVGLLGVWRHVGSRQARDALHPAWDM